MAWGPDVEGHSLLYAINLVVTLLSLAGSLYMTFYCLQLPPSKFIFFKLLSAIAISDVFYSLANLMSVFEDDSMSLLCYVEGFVRQTSFLLTLFFTTCLAIFCSKITNLSSNMNQDYFFKSCLLIGTVISLCFAVSPIFFGKYVAYKNGDLYCEIGAPSQSTRSVQLLALIVTEGIPILAAIIITFIAYIQTIRRLRSLPKIVLREFGVHTNKLFWYPAVLILTFGPCIAYAFTVKYLDETGSLVVRSIHLMLTHAIGLTNAIVYGVQNMNGGSIVLNDQKESQFPSKLTLHHDDSLLDDDDEHELIRHLTMRE